MVAVTKTKSILSFSILSLFALGFLSTAWLPFALGQAEPGWQQKWDRVLSEAKKEGEVVVWGPPGPNARESLTKGFQKSYPDINIVFTGGSGSRSSPKLLRERRAKRFLVDIHIGGYHYDAGNPTASWGTGSHQTCPHIARGTGFHQVAEGKARLF